MVARGETLSEIAMRHGVSVNKIRKVNALNSDIVRVGAGYVLRLESDPTPNDTVRLWVQARI